MATMSQVIIDFEARIADAEKNIAKINKDLESSGKAAKKSSSELKKAQKSVANFYGKILAGAAALRSFYNATRDNIQANAKLNAILKATGGAAGVTKSSIKSIVKEMKAYSGASEASTKDTAAMLLTFTKINKDIFPDTLKIASDLSAAFGQDMKSSAIQLGKALNDPAKGYTALQRIGVSFSDTQVKQIKYFSQTNQLAKAQGVILKELQNEFGGTAAALNATPIGQVETAMNQLKDAMAAIGKVVLPIFGSIIGAVGDFVTAITKAGPAVKVAAAAIAVAVGALTGPVGLIVGLVSAIGLLKSTQATLDDVKTSLSEVKAGFDNLAKQQPLLQSLKKLERGTKEYEKTAAALIKLNPKLAQSGVSVKDSYDDISKAVFQAAGQQEQYLKSVARVQVESAKAVIRQLGQKALFAGPQELLKINKQLQSAYKTLGNAAVVAGVKQTRQWASVNVVADVLGTRINDAKKNYLAFFNAGRAAARGVNKQLKGVSKTVSSLTKAPKDIKVKVKVDPEAEDEKGGQAIEDTVKDSTESGVIDGITTGSEIASKILQKDFEGAFQSAASAFGQYGTIFTTAVGVATTIANAFRKATVSGIAALQKGYEKALNAAEARQSLTESLEKLFGKSVEDAAQATASASGRLGLLGGILGIDTEGLSRDDLQEIGQGYKDALALYENYVETRAKLSEDGLSKEDKDILVEQLREIAETGVLEGITGVSAEYLSGFIERVGFRIPTIATLERDLNRLSETAEDFFDTLDELEQAEIAGKILDQRQEMQSIQDDIRTGLVEEEETLDRQIEIYDDMIVALDGVAGAEELILDLQEERYNLSKKINQENQLAAFYSGEQGAQLESLVNQLKQIEQDVVTGARREGTTATVGAQVGLLDGIINNLRAQGADPALIAEYEAQKADLLRGIYGEAGFQARAGTGAAVGFSVPASFASGTSTTTNTTQNSLSINGQTFNDDTLVQRIVDEINRTYGTNILQGA